MYVYSAESNYVHVCTIECNNIHVDSYDIIYSQYIYLYATQRFLLVFISHYVCMQERILIGQSVGFLKFNSVAPGHKVSPESSLAPSTPPSSPPFSSSSSTDGSHPNATHNEEGDYSYPYQWSRESWMTTGEELRQYRGAGGQGGRGSRGAGGGEAREPLFFLVHTSYSSV